MGLDKIKVKNFRLLKDASMSFEEEEKTTVIVGRNNSGKTSLAELFRKIFSSGTRSIEFPLEDFSLPVHSKFWDAFSLYKNKESLEKVVKELPFIELRLRVSYDTLSNDLGPLSDFIIDLDMESSSIIAQFRYEVKTSSIDKLFQDLDFKTEKKEFFKIIRTQIKNCYQSTLLTIDPTDKKNTRVLDIIKIHSLLKVGFINAQRGLDDTTHREKNFLGKVLEKIFENTEDEMASSQDETTLEHSLQNTQRNIEVDFNAKLDKLIPTLKLFGYPGLIDPEIVTETTLDIQRLLSDHTKIKYKNNESIELPETYNGLGFRNLIYILFQLFAFFREFQNNNPIPESHVVFIEEPEAHLHPQIQEMFIRQLNAIVGKFRQQYEQTWPVQFIVTTHSSHLANEASFESIRYFLNKNDNGQYTHIKDLSCEFGRNEDIQFLHKYLTLTKCDLFFADKAIWWIQVVSATSCLVI